MKTNPYKYESIFITLIISFGLLLRGFNLNFNDFWSDEMVSFYLSDPNLEFLETVKLVFASNLTVTFEIVLKFFHKIFGYNFEYSRYLTVLLSIISIFYFYRLIKINKSYQSAILGIILLSINIYHIRYSVELRSYTLTFLLTIILLNLIFYQGKIKEFKNFLNYLFIFTVSLLMLFSHAYSIIVIISINFYIFLIWVIQKNFTKNNILLFLSTSISSLLFILLYINNISHTPSWIPELKNSFFTNYYFSSFFGSRILGLLHLLILSYLIINKFNKVARKFDIELFLIILLLLTYIIPISYSLIFKPILIDRYIFFVLIPILCLISHFIFQIKPKLFSYSLATLICLITFFNHLFFENTLRQFYTEIYPNKPEIKKVLKHINLSDNSNFTFKTDDRFEINTNEIYENYYQKYLEKLKLKLNYISFKKQNDFPDTLWVIYLKDTTNIDYNISEKFNGYKVVDKKYFNRIELYLLSNKI